MIEAVHYERELIMLKALWRSIFGKTPVPGEVFVFDDSYIAKNPFSQEVTTWEVRIRAVCRGWVNYSYCGREPWMQNESIKQGEFLLRYKRKEQET